MLQFRISGGDLAAPWQADGGGWTSGDSCIRPFAHPALEFAARTFDRRLLVIVRERIAGADGRSACDDILDGEWPSFDAACERLREWPLDFVALQIDARPPMPFVECAAGLWGSAPLYLVAAKDGLRGHWDPAELYPYLGSDRLRPEFAARFLVDCDHPYSRRTMFPAMQRLTERARVSWTPGRDGTDSLRIVYPVAVAPASPRTLRAGADAAAGLEEILTASIRRSCAVPAAARSAQLSGGLDSGVVAAALSRVDGEPPRTFGLVMPGDAGTQQRRRRREMIDRFGFRDACLDAVDYLPFSSHEARAGGAIVPWGEVYVEAFDALLSAANSRGSVVSFNGTGGDELCSRHWHEMSDAEQARRRQAVFGPAVDAPPFLTPLACEAIRDTAETLDRAPVAPLFTSALDAASAVSAMFLRRGVWPISPLCTPELVTFCRALPLEWREGRRIQREVLARMGCSRRVTHPEATEDFGPVLDLSIRTRSRAFLHELFREPRLGELGLVDADTLRTSYARHVDAGGGDSTPFYAVAILELALRSVRERTQA